MYEFNVCRMHDFLGDRSEKTSVMTLTLLDQAVAPPKQAIEDTHADFAERLSSATARQRRWL